MSGGGQLLASLGDRLAGLRGRITANAEMEKITWFRAGGIADALFQPADEEDLATFLKAVPAEIPLMVVGIGSNLLVREGGIRGFVVRLSAKGFGEAEIVSETRIRAGAATPDKRKAHFVSALCVAWPDGHLEEVEARADGTLVWPPRGTAGFGYDPVFLPNGYEQTFAELDPEEKHRISHRADAFAKLVADQFA